MTKLHTVDKEAAFIQEYERKGKNAETRQCWAYAK